MKHEYIEAIAVEVARESKCPKAKVGAVFVTFDFEILSTGYNGQARGMPHCSDVGHPYEQNHIHAEMNAILTAAKNGIRLENSYVFITHAPCRLCMMMLINLKVKGIYVGVEYEERLEGCRTLKKHYEKLLGMWPQMFIKKWQPSHRQNEVELWTMSPGKNIIQLNRRKR